MKWKKKIPAWRQGIIELIGERALSKDSGIAKTALRNHHLKPYQEAAKTETEEILYRTETRTDTWTDEDGNTHTDTYEVEVPYTYYIMTMTFKNHGLFYVAKETLTAEQLEMYRAYQNASGNMPCSLHSIPIPPLI